ncbi:hypothetical protein CLV30_13217 [Haloactinopolyspora alba]|uniref:Peptidoglycan binding protein n=1 Tax=Haloactinopolyspora alba TaxID=648780 RepID=A0A2P8D5B3_9ACTN|nr:peptidoglycan-binding protein [Haloactinopolyspora alba]PSK92401.1 hypothetical protein CLV30_13217 [Haloactinopolyspora alba]
MSGRRNRTVVIVAAVAAGALGVGVFAGTRITSPADAAARTEPPEATDVTVPVERRPLKSEVVTRGDVTFAGSVDISPEVGGLSTPPIVTGRVPKAGDTVKEGEAVLEIVGRPLIVLAGELPMYRSLRPGMSGPDVQQLEKTLDRLGFDPGDVDDSYTAYTGGAVEELFESVGYEPPQPDPQAEAELEQAQKAVDAAEDAVANAEKALEQATSGPPEAEKVAAQNQIDQAERALDDAEATGDENAIAAAKDQLELAEARMDDLMAEPDTSAQEEALADAEDQLEQAQQERDTAQVNAGTPLPAAEIVFVPSLPRRVDEVNVGRGDAISGAAMAVSGADLVVTANVDEAAREVLRKKMKARIEVPEGDPATGTITAIEEAEGKDASGYDVTIKPGKLTADQAAALRGANVKVTIPVQSTDGAVLAVPLAALTAGPGGKARVQVRRDGTTELVEVEVGLTANGYAEVSAPKGELAEGDLVVVGEDGDDTGG